MWVYCQSSGKLYHNGQYIATGFSGRQHMRNKPWKQDIKDWGPIPCGPYTIGKPFLWKTEKGQELEWTMRLEPGFATKRSGFLIHGGNSNSPDVSKGCIILDWPVRVLIAASKDAELKVIAYESEGIKC
jgi:hypothetical protein